jgi:hypothetical protein
MAMVMDTDILMRKRKRKEEYHPENFQGLAINGLLQTPWNLA